MTKLWLLLPIALLTLLEYIDCHFTNSNITLATLDSVEWTQTAYIQSWQSISISLDGSVMAAVAYSIYTGLAPMFVSIDSGNTWTQVGATNPQIWSSICMSSSGTVIAAACEGYIFVSTDTGQTWSQTASWQEWESISCSSDGSVIAAAVDPGYIFVSINSGDTWIQTASNQEWQSISISSDGSVMAAVVDSGSIFVSTDTANIMVNGLWLSKLSLF